MNKLMTDYNIESYRSIMAVGTYELASYAHNDGYNNVYVIFNQYDSIIVMAWTEFVARIAFNELVKNAGAEYNKRFKVISDIEYPDGTKAYGITIAETDTRDEAKEKVRIYNNFESEMCYLNFDIIDRTEDK